MRSAAHELAQRRFELFLVVMITACLLFLLFPLPLAQPFPRRWGSRGSGLCWGLLRLQFLLQHFPLSDSPSLLLLLRVLRALSLVPSLCPSGGFHPTNSRQRCLRHPSDTDCLGSVICYQNSLSDSASQPQDSSCSSRGNSTSTL